MLLIIPQTPGEHIFAFLEQLHGPKACGIRRHGQWLEERKQGLVCTVAAWLFCVWIVWAPLWGWPRPE